ncbi:GSU2403 family nucleotidyltransferase fold protein [Rhizobium rhizophilum]|uniref:Nucleotidyltransferase-like domain-containing protein n=1 Tax=Rhizobium rhizophilum TaxID=1850373 RepID=A0ABY2QS95_9HYPH|nr:hypothetical protein E9677_18585 [Rhizobium rhizophilum]
MTGKSRVTAFENRSEYRVEFLTSCRASDDLTGRPSSMAALGGVGAEPLRYLDFPIRDPMRTVMLHRGGISAAVSTTERYTAHSGSSPQSAEKGREEL